MGGYRAGHYVFRVYCGPVCFDRVDAGSGQSLIRLRTKGTFLFYNYMSEVSNKEILEEVKSLSKTVQGLAEKTNGLSETIQALSGKTQAHSETIQALSGKTEMLSETVHGLSEKHEMLSETTHNLSEAIQALASHMDKRFDQVDERFKGVDQRFEHMDERINLRFDQLERTLEERITDLRKDITLQFEGVYKRLDLANERIDKLYIAVDGFIVLHKKLEQEFVMLQSKYERLEQRISKLETQFAMGV